MTKEKELGIFIVEMVNSLPDSGDNFKDCFTLAKAIIARYPQITKKPLPITTYCDQSGRYENVAVKHGALLGKNALYEWLDSHYVEVVS